MNYAVILAGGSGKRLWPLSRAKRPKQVLKLLDGQTLLHRCFERLKLLFDVRNIIVLTNAGYVDVVSENLTDIVMNNLIAEPVVRDTAGAIGLVSSVLSKYDPDATLAIVTADQIIKPDEVFQQAIKDALAFVNKNPEKMITFGVKPTFPSTVLGYIKCSGAKKIPDCQNKIYSVEEFKEKPDEETAKQYLDDGKYFWNSGMFVWKAKTILANIEKYLPQAIEPLAKIRAAWNTPNQQQVLKDWFAKLPKISIDYAVMEKAENIYAIRLDCSWLDMGSFAALADVISSDKNNNIVVAEKSELLDCRNNIIVTEDKGHLIAAVGLENMIIAHSPDATFICPANQTQRIKELLDLIQQNKGDDYL
jgi:mannose-1-phosphate guanylyltransferase